MSSTESEQEVLEYERQRAHTLQVIHSNAEKDLHDLLPSVSVRVPPKSADRDVFHLAEHYGLVPKKPESAPRLRGAAIIFWGESRKFETQCLAHGYSVVFIPANRGEGMKGARAQFPSGYSINADSIANAMIDVWESASGGSARTGTTAEAGDNTIEEAGAGTSAKASAKASAKSGTKASSTSSVHNTPLANNTRESMISNILHATDKGAVFISKSLKSAISSAQRASHSTNSNHRLPPALLNSALVQTTAYLFIDHLRSLPVVQCVTLDMFSHVPRELFGFDLVRGRLELCSFLASVPPDSQHASYLLHMADVKLEGRYHRLLLGVWDVRSKHFQTPKSLSDVPDTTWAFIAPMDSTDFSVMVCLTRQGEVRTRNTRGQVYYANVSTFAWDGEPGVPRETDTAREVLKDQETLPALLDVLYRRVGASIVHRPWAKDDLAEVRTGIPVSPLHNLVARVQARGVPHVMRVIHHGRPAWVYDRNTRYCSHGTRNAGNWGVVIKHGEPAGYTIRCARMFPALSAAGVSADSSVDATGATGAPASGESASTDAISDLFLSHVVTLFDKGTHTCRVELRDDAVYLRFTHPEAARNNNVCRKMTYEEAVSGRDVLDAILGGLCYHGRTGTPDVREEMYSHFNLVFEPEGGSFSASRDELIEGLGAIGGPGGKRVDRGVTAQPGRVGTTVAADDDNERKEASTGKSDSLATSDLTATTSTTTSAATQHHHQHHSAPTTSRPRVTAADWQAHRAAQETMRREELSSEPTTHQRRPRRASWSSTSLDATAEFPCAQTGCRLGAIVETADHVRLVCGKAHVSRYHKACIVNMRRIREHGAVCAKTGCVSRVRTMVRKARGCEFVEQLRVEDDEEGVKPDTRRRASSNAEGRTAVCDADHGLVCARDDDVNATAAAETEVSAEAKASLADARATATAEPTPSHELLPDSRLRALPQRKAQDAHANNAPSGSGHHRQRKRNHRMNTTLTLQGLHSTSDVRFPTEQARVLSVVASAQQHGAVSAAVDRRARWNSMGNAGVTDAEEGQTVPVPSVSKDAGARRDIASASACDRVSNVIDRVSGTGGLGPDAIVEEQTVTIPATEKAAYTARYFAAEDAAKESASRRTGLSASAPTFVPRV